MSLNKFTDVNEGVELGLKIGAVEMKTEGLRAIRIDTEVFNSDEINADEVKANIVNSGIVNANDTLRGGLLEYPTSMIFGIPYQIPVANTGGTLTIQRPLNAYSHGYIATNEVKLGADIPVQTGHTNTTFPDTAYDVDELPLEFCEAVPDGIKINQKGKYKIIGFAFIFRSAPDIGVWFSIKSNSTLYTQNTAYTSTSCGGNAQALGLQATQYLDCAENDIIRVGISSTNGGGTYQFSKWGMWIEFIKDLP